MKTDWRSAQNVAHKATTYDIPMSLLHAGNLGNFSEYHSMTCFHSKPAWKSTLPNEAGNHPLHFGFRTDRNPDYFIDCGKCEGCRARQKRDWAIRIAHESQNWDRNCFITLTYDDEHLPGTIRRDHAVKFIKRLRKHSSRPIRYFLTGEYGERTKRPHYHAIIFNEDFLGGAYTISDQLYGSAILDGIWKNGSTAIADFTFGSAMYTAGYCAKKIDDTDTFSIQSRNPPLGKEWVRRNHDNIRRNENIVINGQSMPIPKVYLDWLKGTESFNHIKENLSAKIKPLNDQKLRSKKLAHNAQQSLRKEKC